MRWLVVFLLPAYPLVAEAKDLVSAILAKNEPTVIIAGDIYNDSETEDFLKPANIDPLSWFRPNHWIKYEIFSRPFDIDFDRQYSSSVFTNFHYDYDQHRLTGRMIPDLQFDDGTALDAETVALNISRVAYFTPMVSPFDRIKGIDAWRKSPTGLPTGIVVEGSTIHIDFLRDPDIDPYYWGTFPRVSIIPNRCINPKTFVLNCHSIPASGVYRIAEHQGHVLTLSKRHNDHRGRIPKTLHLISIADRSLSHYLDQLQSRHVTLLMSGLYFVDGLTTQVTQKFRLTGYTENHHMWLVLDPLSSAFNNQRTRLYFAQAMRKVLDQMGIRTEGSVIPVLNSGYLNLEELNKASKPFTEKEITEIEESWRKHPPTSGPRGSRPQYLDDIPEKMATTLGYPADAAGKINYRFQRMQIETLNVHHGLRLVLPQLFAKDLPSSVGQQLSHIGPENRSLNEQFTREVFEDATVSPIFVFGGRQLLTKDSRLAFPEQFIRQDIHRFFAGGW